MRADISVHSRTLSSRTAVEEAFLLGRAWLRSGGKTIPTADPNDAGHGVSTIREVAQEASDILRNDVVMKDRNPVVRDQLMVELELFCRVDPEVTESGLARLKAGLDVLQVSSVADGWQTLAALVEHSPHRLLDIEVALGATIADLRARGYSDDGLHQHFLALQDTVQSLYELASRLDGRLHEYQCYVAADTSGAEDADLRAGGMTPVVKLPFEPEGRPIPRGPFLGVAVRAVEASDAARAGLRRVDALLGAAAVFLPSLLEVRSRVVVVDGRSERIAIDVNENLLIKEKRGITKGQVARVLGAMNQSERGSVSDPVLDAIRYHRKAMAAVDNESRFMYLWLGIERLLLGARDHGRILSAARELVPKAVTIGKLRGELGAFCVAADTVELPGDNRAALNEMAGLGPDTNKLNREAVLSFMLASEERSREFTATFYDHDPRLTQWYFRMRKRLGNGNPASLGPKLAEYLSETTQRMEWHMLRLYRTRNQIAHVGRSAVWIRDLVRHAHYYLTQLVAIVVAHRERDAAVSPVQVITNRVGQMDLYLAMLAKNEPRATTPKALLRPTSLFSP